MERAYHWLDNATRLNVFADEWMGLIAPAVAIATPELTGTPPKYATPISLFITFLAFQLVRRKPIWPRGILITISGCFVLYVILAVLGSKH